MNDDFVTVPRHLLLLLEALKPIRSNLSYMLQRHVEPIDEQLDFLDHLSKIFSRLRRLTQNFAYVVNGRLGQVAQQKDASKAEISRAVGDLEVVLDDLLESYWSAKALKVYGAEVLARELVVEIHLDLLSQILAWLDDLIEALSDPQERIRRLDLTASGRVEIPVKLVLTPAPQTVKLMEWMDAQSAKKSNGLGWLGTLGVLWLGWKIGGHLFGDDDD